MFEKTERLKAFFRDKINNSVCHLGIDMVFSVIEIIADSIFILSIHAVQYGIL